MALCQMVLINSFYLLEGPLFGVGFLLLNRKTPSVKPNGHNYALYPCFWACSSTGCRTLDFSRQSVGRSVQTSALDWQIHNSYALAL